MGTRKRRGGGIFNWFTRKKQKKQKLQKIPTETQRKYENITRANTQGLKPTKGFFGSLFTRKVKPKYNRFSATGNKEKNEYLKEFYRKVQSNQLSNPRPNTISAYPLPPTLNIPNSNLNKLHRLESAEFVSSPTVRTSNYSMPGETKISTRRNSMANTQGIELTECQRLEELEEKELRNAINNNKIKYESIKDTYDRVFVFLYYKLKRNPILTNISIQDAYLLPNDIRFPLRLTREQFIELKNAVGDTKNNENFNQIAIKLFNTQLPELEEQIKNWQKHNILIYHNNDCIVGQSSSGSLARTLQELRLSDKNRKNKYNREAYDCNVLEDPTCVEIFAGIEVYIANSELPDHKNALKIVLSNSNSFTAKRDSLIKIDKIIEAFESRKMALVDPKLGVFIQKQYPELWALSYKLDYLDDVDRIVLLTLQKYAVLRRYQWTHEPSWCSDVYTHSYKEPYMAYELLNPQLDFDGYQFNIEEFQEEFIGNQQWAGKVKYKSLKDIKFLPRIPGFQPDFPWKVLELKHDQEVKHPQGKRHANALRNIARNYGSDLAGRQANAWNTLNRLSYPHTLTPDQEVQYKKNYGLHIKIPNNTANTIFTNSNSLALSNTPLSNSNIVSPLANLASPRAIFSPIHTRTAVRSVTNSSRASFGPTYTRRTRRK